MSEKPTRRSVVSALALGAAGTQLEGTLGHAETTNPVPPANETPGTCVLFHQAVEGPFYFDPKLVRSDITEGRPGLPLTLVLKLIDNGSCAPIKNVRVGVWHCDAGGIYSGYPKQGDHRNFSAVGKQYLRGTQLTDAKGLVTFNTIYPGWYPGRTPHIHVKAFLDETTVLTGQVYFPNALSARMYQARAPYDARPLPDQTNETDFPFKEGQREGGGIILAMEEGTDGVTGSLLIAVDRTGAAARRAKGQWRRLFGGR